MTKPSHAISPVQLLTQKLVRIPSITPRDTADLPHIQACLDLLEAEAQSHGARTWRLPARGHHPSRTELNYQVDNLYVEWGPEGAPHQLCFMGHVDVVPPGQGNWSADPYSGHTEDGLMYGRGTTDMKGAVAAFFSAMGQVKPNNHRVGAIITGDEEYAALAGTKHVMQWMLDQGISYPAFLVGEPSSRTTLGTGIKVGRRGSLCGFCMLRGNKDMQPTQMIM